MKLKRLTALLLTIACLSSTPNMTAFAENNETFVVNEGVAPAYEIAKNVSSELNISGATAYCTSTVRGDNTASITVTQTLQKFWGLWIWNDVSGAEWTKTVNYSTTTLSSTKSGLDSGTYRVKSVFELTDQNGETETITIYSDEVTIYCY
ncbi:MAG: hypothetical protein ACI4I1_07135 [Oscillospiraceae bacterium]